MSEIRESLRRVVAGAACLAEREEMDAISKSRYHSLNGAKPESQTWGNNLKQVFVFFIVFCIGATTTFAQDIITLKNGDEIKALVQEVGDVDIKYKKYENPNGPNYTLKKSEIFMIRYQNGSKDVFVTEESKPVETKDISNKPVVIEDKVVKNNDNSLSGKRMFANSDGSVSFEGSDYRIYGKDEMQNFLMNNCRPAFDQYTTGKQLQKSGVICFAVGLPLSCASIGLWFLPGSIIYGPIITGGLTGMWIGGCINMGRGNKMVNGALDTYNRSCVTSKNYSYSLGFGITGNGIGVQLTF